jgi:hypothetical protein
MHMPAHCRQRADAADSKQALFDFSQNLVELWRGSNTDVRREILDCVSLNRTVSDVSLCITKRKPFDFLAERPFVANGRGEWRSFEPSQHILAPFLTPFTGSPEPFILTVDRLARCSA